MAQKTIYIDAESILQLLTHYSEGDLPLDAKLLTAGVSSYLARWIGLRVDSEQWRDWRTAERTQDGGLRPLHIRYEGKKVLVWGDGSREEHPVWESGVEGPKL
jgi:hypothetical protein